MIDPNNRGPEGPEKRGDESWSSSTLGERGIPKLRIMYVVPFFPWPPHTGGQLRVLNVAKGLAADHEVHLVALDLTGAGNSEAVRSEASNIFSSVTAVRHRFSRWKGLAEMFLTFRPYEVGVLKNREFGRVVVRAENELQPDVVLYSRMAGAHYNRRGAGLCRVIDQHDLNRYLWDTVSEGSRSLPLRVFAVLNRWLCEREEERLYRSLDGFVALNAHEYEMTKKLLAPDIPGAIIPNGADTEYFHPRHGSVREPGVMVLTGSMNQMRNIEAAEIAAKELLPRVRERVEGARLFIVGKDPSVTVEKLASLPGVTVTGTVPDIRPFLGRADVIVAPYWSGSGVKHKVPIGLAMEKPVVTTSNGAQGLPIESGRHAIVEDDVDAFADAIVTLMEDPEYGARLAREGRELVLRQLSWSSLGAQMSEFLAWTSRSTSKST